MATKYWVGSGGKQWNTAGNWNPSGVPLDGDDVIFDSSDVDNCKVNVDTASMDSITMESGYTGTLDINGFTLSCDYTADGSDFTGTEGVITGDGIIRTSGTFDVSSSSLTFARENGTIELTGTGNLIMRNTSGNAANNITLAASGKTTTMTANLGVYGTMTLGTGTLTRSSNQTAYLRGSGAPLVNTGTLNVPIIYTVTNSDVTVTGTTYGQGFTVNLSDTYTATLGGNTISSARLLIYAKAGTCTLDTGNYILTVNSNNLDIGNTTHGVLDCGSSSIDTNTDVNITTTDSYILFDTSIWNHSAHWTSISTSGSWDEGSSVIRFDGSSTQNIDNNGLDFALVQLSGTGQKNFTGSLRTESVNADNNVTVQINDTGVTWTTFNGAIISADSTYTLTLRSSVADNQWDMVCGTGNTATRVDVQDSNNTGTEMDASDASNTDSGNNDGWSFAAGVIEYLVGSSAGQSGTSPDPNLEVLREIIGTSDGQSGTAPDPNIKLFRELIGTTAGQAGTTPDPVLKKAFNIVSVAAAGQSNVPDAPLTKFIAIIGSSAGQSGTTPDPNIKLFRELIGATAAVTGTTAVVKVVRGISGSSAGLSTADGTVKLTFSLIGTADGVSTAIAILDIISQMGIYRFTLNIFRTVEFVEDISQTVSADSEITRTVSAELTI